jgi:hypothetical protein
MKWNMRNWQWLCLASATILFAAAATAADDNAKAADHSPAAVQSVDMFAAIDSGDIAVKLIPKDSRKSRVIIANKTDKPLTVKLPSAFAGVPLAQVGGGGHSHSSSGSKKSSQSQSTGGGMGGGGGGGMGGGMFSIAPEKVEKFDVATVCLEHGKAEPHASVVYQIKPIETVSDKPGVRELCEKLGTGKVDQRVAQAAVWHLANNMSWDKLANKKLHRLGGVPDQPYFSQAEIQAAMQLATTAVAEANENASKKKTETASSPSTDYPTYSYPTSSPAATTDK